MRAARDRLFRWHAHTTHEWLGSLVIGGTWLIAVALAQDVGVTVESDAVSGLAGAVVNALTVGGGLATAGWFLLKRIDKTLDAREASRREEKEHDRKREDARDAFFIRQLELCHQEKTDERNRGEALMVRFFDSHVCAVTPTEQP